MASVLKGQAGQPISFETKPKVNGEDVALENQVIGVGQTWQNVTANRSVGVTYTNNTGKPISVMVYGLQSSGGDGISLSVNGVVASAFTEGHQSLQCIVPSNSTYNLTVPSGSTYFLFIWSELR